MPDVPFFCLMEARWKRPLARGDELRSYVAEVRGSRSNVPDARGLLDGKVADARGDALPPLVLPTTVLLPLGGLMIPDSLSLGAGLLWLLMLGLSLLNAFLREDMADVVFLECGRAPSRGGRIGL